MKLTEKQRQVVLDTIVAVDEVRVQLNEEVSYCVTKGIRIRSQQDRLKFMRERLEGLLAPAERRPARKLPSVPELDKKC